MFLLKTICKALILIPAFNLTKHIIIPHFNDNELRELWCALFKKLLCIALGNYILTIIYIDADACPVKAEAEKVGGKVWIESQVDIGTTFIADLPLIIKTKKSS